MIRICDFLKANTSVTKLDLGCLKKDTLKIERIMICLKVNCFEYEGMKAISELLKVNTTLTELNLSRTKNRRKYNEKWKK